MMNSLFCPKCSSPQPMNTHSIDREVPVDDGSNKKVRTTNYHCAICFSFVRSIDEEIQPEEIKPDSESKVATQER